MSHSNPKPGCIAPGQTVTTAGGFTIIGSQPGTPTPPTSTENASNASSIAQKSITGLDSNVLRQMYAELRKESERLSSLLALTAAGLRTVRAELLKQKFGIFPGCYVKDNGKVYLVERVELRDWGQMDDKPWVMGRRIRKDGQPSKGVAHQLFSDWEIYEQKQN